MLAAAPVAGVTVGAEDDDADADAAVEEDATAELVTKEVAGADDVAVDVRAVLPEVPAEAAPNVPP